MTKIYVFIPRPGMTKIMEDYFIAQGSVGIPVSAEAHSDNLTEMELAVLAIQAARIQVANWELDTELGFEFGVYSVDAFHDTVHGHIGWEFEVQLFNV